MLEVIQRNAMSNSKKRCKGNDKTQKVKMKK